MRRDLEEIAETAKALQNLAMSYVFRKTRMRSKAYFRLCERLEGKWPDDVEVEIC